MSVTRDSIRVLHVDDEAEVAELTAAYLEREDDRFSVVTATGADEGLDRLSAGDIDCVVSDYDMPGQDGLEFLEAVRAEYPDLPFILFTGKGSEEIASEAISAGVTDYLQKGGSDRYAVLTNRIVNYVEKYRAERDMELSFKAMEAAREGISLLDEDGYFLYVNQAYADTYGYDREEMLGEHWELIYPEEHVERVREEILPAVPDAGCWTDETEHVRKDGTRIVTAHTLAYSEEGVMICMAHDVTDRHERERALEDLHAATRDLVRAESRQAVAERAVEAARDVLDMPINTCWLYDEPSDSLQPAAATDEALDLFGDLPTYTEGEGLSWAAFEAGEVRTYEDLSTVPGRVNPETPVRSELILPLGEHGVMNIGATEPGAFDEMDVSLARLLAANVETALARAEREEGLQAEHDRFRAVFEEAFDAMLIADDEGRYVDANRSACDLLGLSREELLGRSVAEFAPDDFDFEAAWKQFRASDRERGRFPLVRADGTRRTVEYAATPDIVPGQHLSVLRDITERERVEQELRESEESLQRLYRITSDPDLSFEEKLSRMLDLGRDRLGVDLGFLTRIAGGEQRIVQARGDHPRLQPGETCSLERAYCRKTVESDGLLGIQNAVEAGWEGDPAYELFGLGCYIGGEIRIEGSLYGTLCFADTEAREEPFADAERTFVELLTQWASYELERRRGAERLRRQKERLEEFASVVSHDLRNPLNVLEGSLDLAEETGDPEHFERSKRQVERMKHLIDDLLDLARSGDAIAEVEPVDLAAVTTEAWDTVDTPDADLRVETDRTVRADQGRLRQLLENLFRNAVEHGGDDVTVTVGDLPDGFYVEDNGPGIPEDDREQVFESGYSTATDGTGFGLSIVRQVVEAHGWTVDVTEATDGGARFEITGIVTAPDDGR